MKSEAVILALVLNLLAIFRTGQAKPSGSSAVEMEVVSELSARGGDLPKELHIGNEVFYVEEPSNDSEDSYIDDLQFHDRNDWENFNVADLAFDEPSNLVNPFLPTEDESDKPVRKNPKSSSRRSKSKKVNFSLSTNVNLNTERPPSYKKMPEMNGHKSAIPALKSNPVQLVFPTELVDENPLPSLNNSIMKNNRTGILKQAAPNASSNEHLTFGVNNQKKIKPLQLIFPKTLVDENPLPKLNNLQVNKGRKQQPKSVPVLFHDGIESDYSLLEIDSISDGEKDNKRSNWFTGAWNWFNIWGSKTAQPPKKNGNAIDDLDFRIPVSHSLVNPLLTNNNFLKNKKASQLPKRSLHVVDKDVSDNFGMKNSPLDRNLGNFGSSPSLVHGDVLKASGPISNQKNGPSHSANRTEIKSNVSDNLHLKNSFNNNTVIFNSADKKKSKKSSKSEESSESESNDESVESDSQTQTKELPPPNNKQSELISTEKFPRTVNFDFGNSKSQNDMKIGNFPPQGTGPQLGSPARPTTGQVISPDYHRINPNWSNNVQNSSPHSVQSWRRQQPGQVGGNGQSQPVPNSAGQLQATRPPTQPTAPNQQTTQSNSVSTKSSSMPNNSPSPNSPFNPTLQNGNGKNPTNQNDLNSLNHKPKVKSEDKDEDEDADEMNPEPTENGAVSNKVAISFVLPILIGIVFLI